MSIKLGNAEVNAISIIEPYSSADIGGESFSVASEEPVWSRPQDWLDMPTYNSGDNKIAMLMMVESGVENKKIAIQLRGDSGLHTTIDWGDGSTSLAYGSPGLADHYSHDISYSNLPQYSEIEFNGGIARQALIQLHNASGMDYFGISSMGGRDPSKDSFYINGQSNNIVDIYIKAPSFGIFDNGGGGSRFLERVIADCDELRVPNGFFRGLSNMKVAYIPSGSTTGKTNLSLMFDNCHRLQQIPFFDTSSATSLQETFGRCRSIKEIPDIDTSSCTNFLIFAYECYSLEKFPDLDYSNATTLSHAFMHTNIKYVPHGVSWPTGLYDAFNMFNSCKELLYLPTDVNLSGATTLYNSFINCSKLKKAPPIYAPNATSMRNAFTSCKSLKTLHLEDISSVTDMYYAIQNCSELREVTGNNLPTGVTNFFALFLENHNLIKAPSFYTGNATDVRYMYNNCQVLEEAQDIDMSSASDLLNIYTNCKKIKHVNFLNINNKINDAGGAFANCHSLTSMPSGLFQDYNSCPSKTNSMFQNCNIREAKNINLAGCTNTSNYSPFYNDVDFRVFENIQFGSGTYFYGLLFANQYITTIPDWDVSGVKSLNNAFYGCVSLNWSDLKNTECSISYFNCLLGSGAIENIFNNLASGVTGQTITISQNYGVSELHPDTIAIATSKGWTVTT